MCCFKPIWLQNRIVTFLSGSCFSKCSWIISPVSLWSGFHHYPLNSFSFITLTINVMHSVVLCGWDYFSAILIMIKRKFCWDFFFLLVKKKQLNYVRVCGPHNVVKCYLLFLLKSFYFNLKMPLRWQIWRWMINCKRKCILRKFF